MDNKSLVELRNLKMHFPLSTNKLFAKKRVLKAVDGVSLAIPKRTTYGLVGESGCGKTTVGRCMARLYDVTDGEIIYNGDDISKLNKKELKPYRKEIQLIFQDPYTSLDPRMTVGEIIGRPMEINNICSRQEKNKSVELMLEMVGLSKDYLNRYPHEFSGGQRQRIGIARALALEPKFVICDEPISALDVSIQAQIVNIMEEMQEKFDLTYLFISHDLSIVKHISDHVGVMYLGHLVESAPVDELFENMQHPYTKSLLSAVPIADPNAARQNKKIVLSGDVPSPIDPPSGCVFRTRCSYAMPICATEKPVLKDFDGSHSVACHLV